MTKSEPVVAGNFIRNIITEDLKVGKNDGQVKTRFPPEPNGYLHVGHVKSICLNFGIAEQFNGTCNLRFDDTNPAKENEEYVNAIKADVAWLGFEWNELRHASDYFDQLYSFACELIKQEKAYIDSSSAEEMREMRGTLTEPGDVRFYGIDILFTLLRRIGVVKAKIAGSVELFCDAEIQADRLHMANVKIAVRLWRKSCFDLAIVLADFQVFSDDIPDEIAGHDGL